MPRKRTPTFSVELPLSIRASDEREMLVRLELGRQLYNACLGEALKRLRLMRDSKAWARACSLPRVVNGVLNPLRQEAFAAAALAYGFTSADISSFASQAKNDAGWNEGRSRTDARLGAHEVQRLAERVFKAAQMYCFGKRGRPRFKGKIRPLHSLEGKSDILRCSNPAQERLWAKGLQAQDGWGRPREQKGIRVAKAQRRRACRG